MSLLSVLDKVGSTGVSVGAVVSAMGCAFCFPAIASLAGVIGLGFLGQWEGLFINTLLPAFAWIALLLNAMGYLGHKQWQRSILGMIGPVLLLLSLYPWFQYGWSTYVTYFALGLMVVVSIVDLISPANKRCDDESCAI